MSLLASRSRWLLSSLRSISNELFGRYLLLTNVGISLALSATGDVLQQHYEIAVARQLDGWDAERTGNMAASGVTVGVLCHYWYQWLDRRLPGRTLAVVLRKVVVDQLILSPVQTCLFFTTVGAMEGAKPKEIGQEIVQKGYRLYFAEFFVWPVAQVVNFAFLPTRFRVLYDNTISLGFDIYTSYVKHDTS